MHGLEPRLLPGAETANFLREEVERMRALAASLRLRVC